MNTFLFAYEELSPSPCNYAVFFPNAERNSPILRLFTGCFSLDAIVLASAKFVITYLSRKIMH